MGFPVGQYNVYFSYCSYVTNKSSLILYQMTNTRRRYKFDHEHERCGFGVLSETIA